MHKWVCDRSIFMYDGTFEGWLHGGHYFVVKVGATPYTYKSGGVYTGIGPDPCEGREDMCNNSRSPDSWWNFRCGKIWVEPCMEEIELASWIQAVRLYEDRVEEAMKLAREVHNEQRRDNGAPYLEQHIYPVTLTVLRAFNQRVPNRRRPIKVIEGDKRQKDTLIAALLHDSLEYSHIKEEKLKDEFGENVYRMVKILTKKRPWETEYDEHEYYDRLMSAPIDALTVKFAERVNNLFSLQYTSEEERKKYIEETKEHYLPMAKERSQYFYLWLQEVLNSMGEYKQSR